MGAWDREEGRGVCDEKKESYVVNVRDESCVRRPGAAMRKRMGKKLMPHDRAGGGARLGTRKKNYSIK